MYCPINSGYLCTSVHAHGLIGVWRVVHVEFSKCDGDILCDLMLETNMFQPEVHGYYLVEISVGNYIYRNLPYFSMLKYFRLAQVDENILTRIFRAIATLYSYIWRAIASE